ncbi:hypothetical protein [Brevibacterium litoralis]|uniref:hypothetical protein n=1 Tax=Brevibacterium litoralis TaxID=3138935 RepID=UPI0032EED93A
MLQEPERVASEDDPHEYFDAAETEVATWLRRIGISVRAVRKYAKRRTPDGVFAHGTETVELKTCNSSNVVTLSEQILKGSTQSSFVVVLTGVDDPITLRRGLGLALSANGRRLTRVILVLKGGGEYIEWRS